jgi:hypothetical protein
MGRCGGNGPLTRPGGDTVIGDWLARYRAWRGPRLVWHAELVWLLDELLDNIPRYEHGRWYRYGQWGCTLRLDRYWARHEFEKKDAD